MISLGGLGAAPNAYQGAQARLYELQKQQQDQQAMAAYGQALAALAQQQGGQGPIPGLPQQGGMPQAPMRLPQGMSPPFTANTNVAPLPGPTGSQGVDALTQALIAKTGNAAPQAGGQVASGFGDQGFGSSGSVPAAPAPTQVAASGGPGPPAPQQAAEPVRMPSTAGVQPGSLTWASVVNAIKAANPKISPQALAGAVNNFVPLMQNDQAQQWKAIDERQAAFDAQTRRISASRAGIPLGYEPDPENPGGMRAITGGPADVDTQNVKQMVQGWIDGTVPVPPLSSVNSTSKTMVAAKAEAKRQGFDLTKAAQATAADVAFLRSANSGPQLKMRESLGTALGTLTTLQDSIDAWDAGQFPLLNEATLAAAKQGLLGPEANKLATLLEAQIADTRTTLASAIMGGNTPTDSAFKLAAKQLEAGWSRKTLDAAVQQARTNLNWRLQAMNSVAPVGLPGSTLPPTGGTAPPPAVAPTGPKPGDIKPASDGKQYRFKGGDPYDKANWEPIA